MGCQFSNYQVRCDSQSITIECVREILSGNSYVSPPQKGWITIYNDRSEDWYNRNVDLYILDITQKLSIELQTVAFAFVVFSGIHFLYFVYDRGQLIDEFYDCPSEGYTFTFKKFNASIAARFQGQPNKILPYCRSQTTEADIENVLQSSQRGDDGYLGEDALFHFAKLLDIDKYRATVGYKYFEYELEDSEDERFIEEMESFTLVRSSNMDVAVSREDDRVYSNSIWFYILVIFSIAIGASVLIRFTIQ